jgi:hypothetical protein
MSLDWSAFRRLSGPPWHNFELVCHQVVRRTWGRYGLLSFPERQPGVEFHLLLSEDCELGKAGDRIGWQCRWYELSLTEIGDSRRAKIRKAISTSVEHLGDLTKWILWTREGLSEKDDRWLQTQQRDAVAIEAWNEADLEGRMDGPAASLRETFFGELVLSEDRLRTAYHEAISAIEEKYIPALHVATAPEAVVHDSLGDGTAVASVERDIDRFASDKTRITEALAELQKADELDDRFAARGVFGPLKQAWDKIEPVVEDAHSQLSLLAERLRIGDFESARAACEVVGSSLGREVLSELMREVASADPRDPDQYTPPEVDRTTDALWTLCDQLGDMGRRTEAVGRRLAVSFAAAVGGAGMGKTHLAARIAGGFEDGPPGVLIQGRELPDSFNVDDIADAAGLRGRTFADLLEALDAEGQRSKRRVPVVIDAINEHQHAQRWGTVLARAKTAVARFSNVLVVATLRPSYASLLPDQTPAVGVHGLGLSTEKAVDLYFKHYKIEADLALASIEAFNHPLLLRTFCEATNRRRQSVVRVELGALNLQETLQTYLDSLEEVAQRELGVDPRARIVRRGLVALAGELWRTGRRSLCWDRAKALLGDRPEAWEGTVSKLLEDEGVLHRDLIVGDVQDEEHILISFDRLAGVLAAESLLLSAGYEPSAAGRGGEIARRLVGDLADRHPLADDVLAGLVALLPLRAGQQLWEVADDESLRREAVLRLFTLEGEHLDRRSADQVEAIFIADRNGDRDRIYDGLKRTRALVGHPLGADLVDRLLGRLSLVDRDQSWTEWLRRRRGAILRDLVLLERRWAGGETSFDDRDTCVARWLAWLLTSTDLELRDRATRALFMFGRHHPRALFGLTLKCLEVNDPYVWERLLAASYGVAMAEIRNRLPALREALGDMGRSLFEEMLAAEAPRATTHYLAREYATRLCELAQKANPVFTPDQLEALKPPYSHPRTAWHTLHDGDDGYADANTTLHMDFENYTIGRLVADRGNYQMEHAGYQQVLGEIRWRIHELGYRRDQFNELDRDIAGSRLSRAQSPDRVERYGKKYGWIAFYEQAGRLIDAGLLERDEFYGGRLSDADIDPSFPDQPPPLPIQLPAWVRPTPRGRNRWLTNGIVKVPDELLRPAELAGLPGPWVALDGFLLQERPDLDRRVFGFVRGLLVEAGRWSELAAGLARSPYLGNNRIPEEGRDYYTFAGEIPWCDTFAQPWLSEDGDRSHRDVVEFADHGDVQVEIPVHRYSWEDYHSVTNRAGGNSIPARALCCHLELLGGDRRLDLFDPADQPASLTFGAPEGFEDGSHMVYLREDLLSDYCDATGREFGWVVWGERELHHLPSAGFPDSVIRLYRGDRNAHRRVVSLAQFGEAS